MVPGSECPDGVLSTQASSRREDNKIRKLIEGRGQMNVTERKVTLTADCLPRPDAHAYCLRGLRFFKTRGSRAKGCRARKPLLEAPCSNIGNNLWLLLLGVLQEGSHYHLFQSNRRVALLLPWHALRTLVPKMS